MELGLQEIEKYLRYATQVMDKFNKLLDFILALTMFIHKAQANYDGKIE